jgi:putative membrane protein
MRWWCASSQGTAWDWSWQPYPGVWAFILLLATAYWLLALRPATISLEQRTRRQQLVLFSAGLLSLWLALDWPLGPLGSGYLASVHMVQYLLITLVAPPLILLGIPLANFERLHDFPRLLTALRNLTQPMIAFFVFNIMIIAAHWPSLVDPLMSTQFGSFVIDISWLFAGFVFWWPLISPIPAWPQFVPLLQLAYLGLNGIIPRPPFFILLFSKFPAYATYELAPPIARTTALSDQQLAAGIMKLGSAFIMVVAMAFVFAAWVRTSQVETASST